MRGIEPDSLLPWGFQSGPGEYNPCVNGNKTRIQQQPDAGAKPCVFHPVRMHAEHM